MDLTLDAGALVAVERTERATIVLLERARERGGRLLVPAGALGQVWRDGRRQVRLARLLAAREVTVVPLDEEAARAAGQLCGATDTSDVIDASVARVALDAGTPVVTSDVGDMARLAPGLRLLPC